MYTNTLLDTIFKTNDLFTKVMTLQAIWMDQPLMTSEGLRRRICADMEVKIKDGKLVNLPADEQPTHKILHCMGTINDSLHQLVLIDLNSNEPLTINL